MKFRKLFLTAVTLTAALSLSACGANPGAGAGADPVLKSREDVYGMSAVTTVSLLNSEFAAPAVQRLANAVAAADLTNDKAPVQREEEGETPPENPIEGQLETFHKYFNMLDAFMDSGIGTTVTENADETYAQYAFKMEIAGADLSGEPVTHIMYYNETDAKTETEEEETESEAKIEGVILMFDQEFIMEGERSAETEEDEVESGISIRAYLDAENRDDYVEMTQETESEAGETETEYVYRVFKAGECVEETAVNFESEVKNKKTETEIEIEFRTGDTSGVYRLEKEVKDDKTKIKVSYETVIAGEKVKGVFHVMERTDSEGKVTYHYQFDNGWSQDLDKDGD